MEKKKYTKDVKEEEVPTIRTGSYYKNNHLILEQVYDEDSKQSYFLVLSKDNKIEKVTHYDFEGHRYLPLEGEEISLGVVSLPSKMGYYEQVSELTDEIKEFIRKYLDLDEKYLQFATWYVLLSWVYDKFSTLNYLRALGDTGTGKSRFLDVIGGLCYKNIRGSGAVTVAALKRITKKWGGTLVIDEGDFKESDEKTELIKFFNLGFEKNRPLINCDKNDPSTLEFFLPYCPKIISTRRTFKDKALEARCLTHIMQQTNRKDIPVVLLTEFYQKQKAIMNKLLKFRFDTLFKINDEKEVKLDTKIEIEPRLRQSTYAFLNIFADDKESIDNFKNFIEKTQIELIEERANSFEGMIINAIHGLMEDDFTENITSKDIALKIKNNSGEDINVRVIGRYLRSLGVETKVKKIDKKSKRVLVLSNKISELFKRYISYGNNLEKGYNVTSVTSYTSTAKNNKRAIGVGGTQSEGVDVCHVTNVTNVTDENSEISTGNEGLKCLTCGIKSPPAVLNKNSICDICEDLE